MWKFFLYFWVIFLGSKFLAFPTENFEAKQYWETLVKVFAVPPSQMEPQPVSLWKPLVFYMHLFSTLWQSSFSVILVGKL